MKVSLSWLREWVNPPVSDEELMATLTMAGLEIDGVEAVAGEFSQVVVGEIISVKPHPDADKLNICEVAGHPEGNRQVVCGAPNAKLGLKIPFALVGAVLPTKKDSAKKAPAKKEKDNDKKELLGSKPFEIKEAKLRGVESHGMLCGADELGIDSANNDGLMELPHDAPVGESLQNYLALHDEAIELSITPNRADCLSVRGITREISVLTHMPVETPVMEAVKESIQDVFSVELRAPEQCSRYAGRVIKDIDINQPSPLWLQEKLRRSGIRSIDAVVDVTNYVLLELGQPMHAFDLKKLTGGIQVRQAQNKEKLLLLNDQEVELSDDTLVIADEEQALAMAGIMGGKESAVSDTTKDIFLESAYFDPIALAGKARAYGLHTDSSHRFERGVDSDLQVLAIERATALLLEIVGGKAGPVILKEIPEHLPKAQQIVLRLSQVKKYLGLSLSEGEVVQLLQSLGMELDSTNETGPEACLFVKAPSWRFDVSEEVDLLEEIARIIGYNNLPTSAYPMALSLSDAPERHLNQQAHKDRLVSLGYQEIVSYSFVDPVLQKQLGLAAGQVEVENPISTDMSVMRTSLLPGLLSTALYNLNRQQTRIRLFEAGLTFAVSEQDFSQQPALSLLLYGEKEPESWSRKSSQLVDFYDIKGSVEALFLACGREGLNFEASEHPALHPGQNAAILLNDEKVGFMGALHPAIQQELGFEQPVFLAQVKLSGLLERRVSVFEPLSRFPAVRRDLAFIVDKATPVETLLEAAKKAAGTYLTNLKVFDVYSGKGIDFERKSVGLGLTFQAKSRTLTDSEINESVDRVVDTLKTHFQADLRS